MNCAFHRVIVELASGDDGHREALLSTLSADAASPQHRRIANDTMMKYAQDIYRARLVAQRLQMN